MKPPHWVKCRHAADQASEGLCVLPPGVLVCPCLGAPKDLSDAARLSVDDAGQIVWVAFDREGNPAAHQTFVAMRKNPQGQHEAVALTRAERLVPVKVNQEGRFLVTDRQNQPCSFGVKEFMENAAAGEEFVTL
jgi:hypothetical protein